MAALLSAAVPHGFRSSFRDWAAEETDHPRKVAGVRWRTRSAAKSSRPTAARTCLTADCDSRRTMPATWPPELRAAGRNSA